MIEHSQIISDKASYYLQAHIEIEKLKGEVRMYRLLSIVAGLTTVALYSLYLIIMGFGFTRVSAFQYIETSMLLFVALSTTVRRD